MSISIIGRLRVISPPKPWPFVVGGLLAFAVGAWEFEPLVQQVQQRYGAVAARLVRDWEAVLQDSRSLSEENKLKRVNEFFNRQVRYDDDIRVWGVPDYWATPLEFMGKGVGDCEDFSLAKYFSLREIGVAPEKLRMTYVRARIGGPNSTLTQAHMVLAYYPQPDAEPLILDNLISEIRPASRRTDLTPVYSFNTTGVFAGTATQPAASVDRLSRWKDLLMKMRTEGMAD